MKPHDISTPLAQTQGSRRNFPHNCWWVAAAAEEISRKPVCRWLLEHRVVLFRTEDGTLAALEDRCAHRWAALSQGRVLGNDIACPYHGFRYNTRGTCTHVPTQSHVPAALKVRSYPVHEHGSFVWIWMGDPAKADPALLPDIPWFTDSGYFQSRGYTELSCNYMLLQENVLDLTHVAHLHADPQMLESEQAPQPPADVKVSDRSVTFVLRNSGVPLATFQATPMGIEAGRRVDRLDWGTFACPACHFAGFDIEDPAPACGKRGRYNLRAMHCTTPISPTRCHYWWAVAQDYGHDVPDMAGILKAGLEATVKQDKDVLEAIQMTIDQDMRADHAPELLLVTDRAAVEARRILKKMLEAESL